MEKKLKYLIGLLLVISGNVFSEDLWTDWAEVDIIYTYNSKDSLYVYLKDVSCPNTKKYFTISGDVQDNASQLISMILAARMAKVDVNIQYDPAAHTAYCYVKGLQLKN